MARLFLLGILAFVLPIAANAGNVTKGGQFPTALEVVERARATIGSDRALDSVVTLSISGLIEPANSKLPEAGIRIIARKPASRRLEVHLEEVVETTVLNGGEGALIRSHPEEDLSWMRPLTEKEVRRMEYDTRRFFNFYRPDTKRGERIRHGGIERKRGVRCHKLVYSHPKGMRTTRYFAVHDATLVSTVSGSGLESVEVGRQTAGGIRFPERIDYYEGGDKLHSLVLSQVRVNKPLSAGVFAIPGNEN